MRPDPAHRITRAVRTFALCFAIVVAGTATAQESAKTGAQDARRKVIIDDEGFALMHLMLLGAPDVDVVGITTVSGNVWANRATALALRGVEITGRTDIPVVQGATYPLLNSEALTDRWEALYGKLTWKGAWMKAWVQPTQQTTPPYYGPTDPVVLPGGNAKTKPSLEIAAMFLIRMVHAHPGEITIVAAGPLTNLALAQRLDPSFAGLVKELVYMGGSLNPRQVLSNPSANEFAREYVNTPRREFNIRFDPEAASIVLRSPWKRVTLVPVDPATATQLSVALRDRLAKVADPAVARFITAMEPGFPLWDEVAAAVWLDPTIVTARETLFVDANTQFGAGYGDLLSWDEGYQPGLGEQRATVVRSVDPARLEALMTRLIANGGNRRHRK
ncbi:nucleoside hydrolase [Sphingomonas sp. CFBP 13603]|uniref:nucleoside hydrolase n=1 Tax=Sphingomonas sp. CFBP 13603 TaxID=2774040 RepID=UPI0018676C2A|nr:nucleoside hydrolase [Sphingomonas sp. CFBP 13603]MBE2992244.1 nucleoside hydrolase [Sphingomonas sp. CFBP 13603]